jgi:Protein of unknown function (DUF2380)
MMRFGSLARMSAVVFCVLTLAGAACAAPAAAIFPFEIYDTSGEPPQPDLTERLAMATRVLSEALEKTGRYTPVDLGPLDADVAATSPRIDAGTASWRLRAKPARPTPSYPWCTRSRR